MLAPRVRCVSLMHGVGTGGQDANWCKKCYKREPLRSVVNTDEASFRGYNRHVENESRAEPSPLPKVPLGTVGR